MTEEAIELLERFRREKTPEGIAAALPEEIDEILELRDAGLVEVVDERRRGLVKVRVK